ncbi:glycosyltransferase family 4 protein [Paludibaculum fermentans]|uniref:Glycosyltransferase family 4 protein n=1 Tax=Paludibaculum fermentans TaxID=1473598 RepID=A0A7S7SJW6_PALFE|nr:glycosyltransferase family 4 protein [Paludibaculum fermentans]QOY87684.1 glycosyltransferase family 4 protein [Paludibaculum fermentans]
MKTLYIAFDIFPRAKGSSSHIASMVTALERTFGAVELICLGTPEMPAYQREGGIEIYRFRKLHRDLLARATAFAQFVAQRVHSLRGSLTLSVFRDPWGGYPLLRATPGCPVIFEVNALPTWELGYSRPALAANAALRAKLGDMERRCLREAARVLCVSSVTRDALAGLGVHRAKIDVIPNEARDLFFAPPGGPSPIPALDSGKWFAYIGSLQSWQGVEAIIDAFALAAPDCEDSRMLILHSGQARLARPVERAIARRQLGGRILLHPPLDPEGVAGVLQRVRFTVVPLADTPRNTVQGCCPVKMIESMAAAAPVIASDLAVCREWLQDGTEGLLAAPGGTRDWALAIRRLMRDEPLRRSLSQGARRRAEACFAPPVIQRQLEQQFLTAAGGGNR